MSKTKRWPNTVCAKHCEIVSDLREMVPFPVGACEDWRGGTSLWPNDACARHCHLLSELKEANSNLRARLDRAEKVKARRPGKVLWRGWWGPGCMCNHKKRPPCDLDPCRRVEVREVKEAGR